MRETFRNSSLYRTLTHDYTIKDFVGPERYGQMRGSQAYKLISDWSGLAANKLVLGMYVDAKTGLTPSTSLLARTISLGFHSIASPMYTMARDKAFESTNTTENHSWLRRNATELIPFIPIQGTLYVVQIAAAMAVMSNLDASIELDYSKLPEGALHFLKNSVWLSILGRWSMNTCRRFFEQQTPEEGVLENILEPI